MLTYEQKAVFEGLGLEFPAVALKYCFDTPEGVEPVGKKLSFCQFVKEVQDSGRTFYTTAADDDCYGKLALGQIDKPALGASGVPGFDFGVFKTPAGAARLYNTMPTLTRGAHNYTVFAPVSTATFDPDLIICIADTRQADILMRATSYISGDLWESKSSHILSCVWTYAYPFISGKVNFCITGMHHGMKRRKIYPEGLHIISIPFQKILEVTTALQEMDWELIAMRDDEESKRELAHRMDRWERIGDFSLKRNETQ
jgi:uncharacterized protein (DUF169 family)